MSFGLIRYCMLRSLLSNGRGLYVLEGTEALWLVGRAGAVTASVLE